jgi:hypothetical protein
MDIGPPVTDTKMVPAYVEPQSLLGTWRRFGAVGPVYEVIGFGPADRNGHTYMRVRVIESGEEVDYRLTELLDDPKEQ